MGSYFSQLVHEAIISDGESSIKLHGVKLDKKEAGSYALKLAEQLGSRLKYLSIDEAKLKHVPNCICTEMTVLRHLQLGHNQLMDLPNVFGQLKSLQILILTFNDFSRFPSPILQLKSLTRLDLSHNNLKSLIDGIAESLPLLESIDLSFNKLDEAGTWPFLSKCSIIKFLDLSSNNIRHFPLMSIQWTRIQDLRLSRNPLSSLGGLESTIYLKRLDLSRLALDPSAFSGSASSIANTVIPLLCNIPTLEYLDLSHNRIPNLPPDFFQTLTKLYVLKLHNNKLVRLPKEISCLVQLRQLYLHDNQLVKIGKSLSQCIHLEKLHLEFNNLAKLPASLRTLSKLNCLLLHYNKFAIIPEPLYDATFVVHLYMLSLEGNPLTNEILTNIAIKGTREYVLEREGKMREEEDSGKRKGRPSLTRIASQYGSLRSGAVPSTTAPPPLKSKRSLAMMTPGTGQQSQSQISMVSSGFGTFTARSGVPSRGAIPSYDQPTNPLNSSAPVSSTSMLGPGGKPVLTRVGSSSSLPNQKQPRDKTFSRSKTNSSTTVSAVEPISLTSSSTIPSTGTNSSISNNSSYPLSASSSSISSSSLKSRDRAISSPTRQSTTAETLVQIVRSDPTGEVPQYVRFKDAFEAMMSQEDLSDARKEELRKSSNDQKWELLRAYKGSLVQLLSNNTARAEREKKFETWQKLDKKVERLASPQYFISSLKGLNISMGDMTTLKSMFESAPLQWIYEFIDSDGIAELAHYLMNTLVSRRGQAKSPEDIVRETEAVSCLSVLASASASTVLSIPVAIDAVVLCLASDQLATIKPVLQLLLHITDDNTYACKVILASLNNAKAMLNLPNRWSLLFTLLEDHPYLKDDWVLRTDVLALISKFTESEGLIERFLLRKELFKAGLQSYLDDLNQIPHLELQKQLEIIDENTFADSEAVKTLAATDYRVLLRIQDNADESGIDTARDSETEMSSMNSMARDPSNIVAPHTMRGARNQPTAVQRRESVLFPSGNNSSSQNPLSALNLRILVGDLGSTALRYTLTTTVADVIKKILSKYTIEYSDFYTLFFVSTDSDKLEGFWADNPSALISEYVSRFSGACIASFKMKPWRLSVDCPFAKSTIVTDLEPTWSIQQAIAHIVTTNNFSLEDEYEMSVTLDGVTHHNAVNTQSQNLGQQDTKLDTISETPINTPITYSVTKMSTSDKVSASETLNQSLNDSDHLKQDISSSNEGITKSNDSSSSQPSSKDSSPAIARKYPNRSVSSSPSSSPKRTRRTASPARLRIEMQNSTLETLDEASDSDNNSSNDESGHSKKPKSHTESPEIPSQVTPDNTSGSESQSLSLPISTEGLSNDQNISQNGENDLKNTKTDLETQTAQESSQSDNAEAKIGDTVEGSRPTLTIPKVETTDVNGSTTELTSAMDSLSLDSNNNSNTTDTVDTRSNENGTTAEVKPDGVNLNVKQINRENVPIPSPRVRLVRFEDRLTLYMIKSDLFTVADLLEGKVRLQLALKPKKVRIMMGEEGIPVDLDIRWTISELLEELGKLVPEISANLNDYGIIMETKVRNKPAFKRASSRRTDSNNSSQGSSTSLLVQATNNNMANNSSNSSSTVHSEWLVPTVTLAFVDFDSRRHILRLALRPRDLYVLLPSGKTIKVVIGFEEHISQVIKLTWAQLVPGDLLPPAETNKPSQNASEQLQINTENTTKISLNSSNNVDLLESTLSATDFSIYTKSEVLLSRRKTLRDAGIKPGDTLILKQEIETIQNVKEETDLDIWQEPQSELYIQYENSSTNNSNSGNEDENSNTNVSSSAVSSSIGTGNVGVNINTNTPPHSSSPATVTNNISSNTNNLSSSTPGRKVIVYATLNKLIERLTDPDDYDAEFHDIFLFTYRSFTTPEQVLQKLIQRYNVPDNIDERIKDTIRVRICVFLTQWLDKQFQDLDDLVIEKLNMWVEKEIVEDRQAVLLKSINRVRSRKSAVPEQLVPTQITLSQPPSSLLDLEIAQIAQQLTLETWRIYSQIKPIEFFGCAWTKPDGNVLSPNVLAMIQLFNNISAWVATEICSDPKLRSRRTKFTKIIKIAVRLKEMNNYHLLYAFISGWNSGPVSRLKWTREKLNRQTRQMIPDLEDVFKMEGSFKAYRDSIKRLGNVPVIPYIGILLKDLTFIEDGNLNEVDNLINWYKRRLVYAVVGEYLRTALVPFRAIPLIVNGIPVSQLIKNLRTMDENALYDASLVAEPRGVRADQLK